METLRSFESGEESTPIITHARTHARTHAHTHTHTRKISVHYVYSISLLSALGRRVGALVCFHYHFDGNQLNGVPCQGEYIAPERLEAIYTRSKYVQQCFVDGDSMKVSSPQFTSARLGSVYSTHKGVN